MRSMSLAPFTARLRARLSYSNVAATLALVLAMSGGAYALSIPDDSVGTRHLKDGAVTTAKLRGDAVTSAKVDDGTLRAADLAKGQVLTWRGTWSPSADYALRDIVFREGSSYVAVEPNTNSEPPSADWKVLAARGAPGPSGSGPEIDYQRINHTGFDLEGTQILSFRGFQLRLQCFHSPNSYLAFMALTATSSAAGGWVDYSSVYGDAADASGAATLRQNGVALSSSPVEVARLSDFNPVWTRGFIQLTLYSPGEVVVVDVLLRMVERHTPQDVSCFAKGAAVRGI